MKPPKYNMILYYMMQTLLLHMIIWYCIIFNEIILFYMIQYIHVMISYYTIFNIVSYNKNRITISIYMTQIWFMSYIVSCITIYYILYIIAHHSIDIQPIMQYHRNHMIYEQSHQAKRKLYIILQSLVKDDNSKFCLKLAYFLSYLNFLKLTPIFFNILFWDIKCMFICKQVIGKLAVLFFFICVVMWLLQNF